MFGGRGGGWWVQKIPPSAIAWVLPQKTTSEQCIRIKSDTFDWLKNDPQRVG